MKKINDYIGNMNINKELNKNTIICFYRIIRFLLNRFNNIEINTSHPISFTHPKNLYTADTLINAFKNHETFFKVLDVRSDIFPPNKWYLINITEKEVSILIRGTTNNEANYFYKVLRNVVKEAKSINWSGKCKIFRSYEFD